MAIAPLSEHVVWSFLYLSLPAKLLRREAARTIKYGSTLRPCPPPSVIPRNGHRRAARPTWTAERERERGERGGEITTVEKWKVNSASIYVQYSDAMYRFDSFMVLLGN